LKCLNVDFWCVKTDQKEFKYFGSLGAFRKNYQNMISNLCEENQPWIGYEKGDCFYFYTLDNIEAFNPKEKEILEFTLNKTIANTSDVPFNEQKELFSNSIEVIEAGNDNGKRISIFSFSV